MSTIANEIERIQFSKADIKAAIEAKGVNVGDGLIDTYADKIDLIDEWVAPSDWIQLEEPADNEILLLASDIVPYYRFYLACVGGYYVDWGDGVISTYSSGQSAEHTYTVGNGQVCSRGYTTFKIRIYAQNPINQITSFYLQIPLGVGLWKNYINGLLWARLGTTGLISLNRSFSPYNGYVQYSLNYLECIELPESLTQCTSFFWMAGYAMNLQKIIMPKFYSSSNISFEATFAGALRLKNLDLNTDAINASSLASFCSSCNMLRKLKLPTIINNCTSFNYAFASCFNLEELILPEINTNCQCESILSGNRHIKRLDFPASWNNRIIRFFYNFDNIALEDIVIPDGTNSPSLSNFIQANYYIKKIIFPTSFVGPITGAATNAFNLCQNLKEIVNLPNLSAVNNIVGMFNRCYLLDTVNNLDLLGDTTTGMDLATTYIGCYSLNPSGGLRVRNKVITRFVLAGGGASNTAALQALLFTNPAAVSTWAGASPQIDVAYCSMDAAALNALFTSIIATSVSFSGKTIRITGNPGANTCDTTIITNAGGTVNKTT